MNGPEGAESQEPQEPQTCFYCPRPVAYLCDKPKNPDVTTLSHLGEVDQGALCSRPLCQHHRVLMSSAIVCTRGRGGKGKGKGGGGHQSCCQKISVDYCPEHGGTKGYLALPNRDGWKRAQQ